MRNATPGRWRQWRVKLVPTNAPTDPPFARRPLADEQPGPDGIRHGLVARIRREIEAGTYDTEERWLAAEELLLRRFEQSV
jgi:hypothetical protein